MGHLAHCLQSQMPSRIPSSSHTLWSRIVDALSSDTDLESALLSNPPDEHIESAIVDLTSGLILDAEQQVIESVISGRRTLRFSLLLPQMVKPPSGIPIITTNYDRLLEVAVEQVGLEVNSLFVGHHFGRLDPVSAHFSLCKQVHNIKGKAVLKFAEHVVLLKPHGSLDWYMNNGDPIRCSLPVPGRRLIITPGFNKYRGGYDRPFDSHRERANREIDKASRFLFIGYGFRDEHLQTHLEHELKKGKPALLISHGLTPPARRLINECGQMIALCAGAKNEDTEVITQSGSVVFPGLALWDLGVLVKEVLET